MYKVATMTNPAVIYSTAPGPVGSINVTVASPMEVTVSWAPVAWEEANGDIQFYHVILSRYEGPELNRILVNASGILRTQFSGLGKKK